MADRTFEDEFMDIQTGLVSLVLEAVAAVRDVSRVYIFCSIEGGMTSFNAFLKIGDSFQRLDAVVGDRRVLMQVMGLGSGDLASLKALCDRSGRACPTQIRGRYVVGGAYDARYEYERIASREEGARAPGASFSAWLDSVREGDDELA